MTTSGRAPGILAMTLVISISPTGVEALKLSNSTLWTSTPAPSSERWMKRYVQSCASEPGGLGPRAANLSKSSKARCSLNGLGRSFASAVEFALSVHTKTPPKLIRQSNASIPRIKVIPKRRDRQLDQGLFLGGFATLPLKRLLNI